MAWQGRLGPARWWLGAALGAIAGPILGVGCTAPNPAFDGGGETAAQDESTSQGPTTVPDGTSTTEVDVSAGTVAGMCEVTPAGSEVFVGPMGGVSDGLCGSGYVDVGLLRFTGTTYELYPGQSCTADGEPIVLQFIPKGPNWPMGSQHCVQYDITYRPDCSFQRASIRYYPDQRFVFAAGTEAMSAVSELELVGLPRGDVCQCDSAQCCDNAPPPGAYFIRATAFDGESADVDQGSRTTFETADGMFDFDVSQARVVDDCSDPRQFDWHFRRLGE